MDFMFPCPASIRGSRIYECANARGLATRFAACETLLSCRAKRRRTGSPSGPTVECASGRSPACFNCTLWYWCGFVCQRGARTQLDNADRLGQVGVVGDENGDITTFEAGIANHVRCNIDVGAFLSVLSTQTLCVGVTPLNDIRTEWVRK